MAIIKGSIHGDLLASAVGMRHVLSALVQNVPGVLAHVAGMLASRGYNIDSLAVGETEDPALSRMTFVVVGDDSVLGASPQAARKDRHRRSRRRHQLARPRRARPDAHESPAPRAISGCEIHELCSIFRGKVVDVAPEQVIVEISGQEKKIEAFIDLMRPFGIVELVRTGRIAMVRGVDRSNNGHGSLHRVAGAAVEK